MPLLYDGWIPSGFSVGLVIPGRCVIGRLHGDGIDASILDSDDVSLRTAIAQLHSRQIPSQSVTPECRRHRRPVGGAVSIPSCNPTCAETGDICLWLVARHGHRIRGISPCSRCVPAGIPAVNEDFSSCSPRRVAMMKWISDVATRNGRLQETNEKGT